MDLSRRTFLGSFIVLPALAAATGIARADDSKASQASMHYQTTPSGNAHCATCKFFIPGSDASSNGACKIVDGTISPNGYCMAYTAS
jgi:hypothetical protein